MEQSNVKTIRKHYTAEQKVKILREHLENQVSLSELGEKYQIHMNDLYRWKKQLFEGAAEIFNESPNGKISADEKKMEQLKEKLKSNDQLISELVEKNIGLKKT